MLASDSAFTMDYLEAVRPASLAPVERAEEGDAAIVAARMGGTRLLDSVLP